MRCDDPNMWQYASHDVEEGVILLEEQMMLSMQSNIGGRRAVTFSVTEKHQSSTTTFVSQALFSLALAKEKNTRTVHALAGPHNIRIHGNR